MPAWRNIWHDAPYLRKWGDLNTMINIMEVTETNKMVEKENLDVRTITMGINLLDCAGPD